MMKVNLWAYIVLLVLLVVSVMPLRGQSIRERLDKRFNEVYRLMHDSPEEALTMAYDSYDLARESGDIWMSALIKTQLGFIKYDKGDLVGSYTDFISALDALDKSDTTDLYNSIAIFDHLATVLFDFGIYDQSIEFNKKALVLTEEYNELYPEHFKENDGERLVVDFPFYIIVCYIEMKDYEIAEIAMNDLWNNIADRDDIRKYAYIINERGILKKRLGDFGGAKKLFFEIVNAENVKLADLSMAYHNLGDIFLEEKLFDKAEYNFLKALELRNSIGESDESSLVSILDLGEVFFEKGDFNRAIDQWKNGVELIDNFNNPNKFEVYDWMAKAYDTLKQSELSNTYRLLHKAKEKEFKSSTEWIQREKEREGFREFLLNLEKEKTIAEARKDYTILIVIFTITAVLITLLTLVYIKKQKQKKLYQQLGDILLEEND